MTDEATTVAIAIVDSLPIPPIVKQLIDIFVPFLVQEVEKLFGKSTSCAVNAAYQDLTNKKYQWILDCITEDIIPDLEERCPAWIVPDIELIKPYVLNLVTSELNKLPAS